MKSEYITPMIVAICLAGCGTMPQINCDKAANVQVGMTEKQVIKLMGEPYVIRMSMNKGQLEKELGWQNQEITSMSSNLLRAKISSAGEISEVSGNCAGKLLGQ